MMITKMTIVKIVKELLIWGLILLVMSNIISYIRKPTLKDDTLPAVTLQTIDKKQINLADYSGKPLLIHFWATWCPTCKLETTNIDNVSKKYQVLTIVVDSGDDDKIKAFMRDKDAHFDVVHDKDASLARDFSVEVFPTTFIYSSEGTLIFSEVGYTSTAGLLARMAWAENITTLN